ncbi:PE_PGRS family protein [Acidisarcina polymorpha]|uniref:PE_PGRS family protein n=2 Tax=Acidisarcina polymorpha TaxID=2211140 RepID=A0A2Z5FZ72_9BACT|nr:PE_PGRS family protein [Acidisarcina polymorpha]
MRFRAALLAGSFFSGVALLGGSARMVYAAQAADSQPAAASRVAGTVVSIAGSVIVVKDDKGTESRITVPDSARVLQLPAGAKSLSAATSIKVQDIAVGDRVLAKIAADGPNFTASTVLAMKQADIAQKQEKDRQDWQARGISGLVTSVDPAAGTISVTTGSGAGARKIVVQASKSTTIRRYAPDSTKFDDAKPATLDQIKAGDQLRAKGSKNADGTEFAAEDIVAGTFRNIAGTVVSVDSAANTVTVNDLGTKKPFVVAINTDSQLHKLPPMMAQGIAMRLKGGGSGAGAAPGAGSPRAGHGGRSGDVGTASAGTGTPATSDTSSNPSAGRNAGNPGSSSAGAAGQRGGELQQALTRAPVLQLADLKKGDAVMVLTTEGQSPGAATAITLIAGVEPILQASPSASQSVLSASWNLGGGAAGGGQDAQ